VNARARALTMMAAVGVLAAATVGAVIVAAPSDGQPAPATTAGAAPTTVAPPTTEAPDCTATTDGRDPEAFTARCAGPIVVTITSATCLGDVGDGYRLSYRIGNRGPGVGGFVSAQVDDRPAIITEPSLTLDRGASFTDTADYLGVSGDGLTVSLVTSGATTITSFPVELPHCRQDPADIRKAQQATSTT
jgi:hypothetical protein